MNQHGAAQNGEQHVCRRRRHAHSQYRTANRREKQRDEETIKTDIICAPPAHSGAEQAYIISEGFYHVSKLVTHARDAQNLNDDFDGGQRHGEFSPLPAPYPQGIANAENPVGGALRSLYACARLACILCPLQIGKRITRYGQYLFHARRRAIGVRFLRAE